METRTMKKVMLITGASRGIGAAVAELAAQRSYCIAINYASNRTAAMQVVERITQAGGQAFAVQGDVGVESDVLAIFAAVDAQWGRLDVLINNAGVLDLQSRVEAMSVERLQRVFNTNIVGSFICAREAIKRMSTRHGGNGGAIVNVSSTAARLGSPDEFVDYAASKGAIDTFTIGLSKEIAADGIRVNAVRPGLIHTDIHASAGESGRVERLASVVPMQRGGSALEVANTIVWLASDEASYVNGAIVDIAGGR
jgi:NAD(P)-dependent dehydrogenase (short-subunit alcohol dehydrogenase family)